MSHTADDNALKYSISASSCSRTTDEGLMFCASGTMKCSIPSIFPPVADLALFHALTYIFDLITNTNLSVKQ